MSSNKRLIDFHALPRNTSRMLLLKRHLVELVRSGKKRQTIRLWTRCAVRSGQISYTPGLGRMKITAVDQLASLHDLSEADARADGFDSLAALLAEIEKIYGATPQGRQIYRIKFEWPIDADGEKLVIAPAPAPVRAQRPIMKVPPPAPPVPRAGTPPMTTDQRRTLRSFILSRKPAR